MNTRFPEMNAYGVTDKVVTINYLQNANLPDLLVLCDSLENELLETIIAAADVVLRERESYEKDSKS